MSWEVGAKAFDNLTGAEAVRQVDDDRTLLFTLKLFVIHLWRYMMIFVGIWMDMVGVVFPFFWG